jgi:hypothetical protein
MAKAEPKKAVRVLWVGLLAIAVFLFLQLWDMQVAFIIAILVFIYGSLALVKTNTKKVSERVHNEIIITSYAKQVWQDTDNGKGWRNTRIETYPRIVNIDDYLAEKGQNKIIAVMGASRSGKSQLVYWLIQQLPGKKIIFQLKASDKYTQLGYPTLHIHKAVPNCFKSSKSFVRAFLTAFSISASLHGITSATLENSVRDITRKSHNWKEFRNELEEQIDDAIKNKDGIRRSALNFIDGSIRNVETENMLDYDLPSECVVDFEGSQDNEMDTIYYIFYTEYLLGQLSQEVWNVRENVLIVIDEAHLLTKSGKSIIPEMTALIGAKGGMILSSQRIADLKGQALDNCKTQFAFKTTGKENLDEIRAISEIMEITNAQYLETYEFTDIAQMRPDAQIWIFKLMNPEIKMYPVKEITMKQADQQQPEPKTSELIDISKEIVGFLSRPANQQDLAKLFTEKYGREIGYWKLKMKSAIKKMIMLNEIDSTITDYVKFVADKPYEITGSIVLHRKGNYDYHDWLRGVVADVLAKEGYVPEIQPHGMPFADIILKKEKLAFEIETGSKQGYKMKETVERFKALRKEGYQVWVIVPNQEVKKKYGEYHTYTAMELWKLKEVIKNAL